MDTLHQQHVVPNAADAAPSPGGALGTGFIHLHLHTEYSLLDGGNRIDKLIARVKELGMPSVGVTDHGNMHGAVAFSAACREAGLRPILGIEAYVAPGARTSREYTGVMDGGYHLVLLAETPEGWKNLLYLSSESFLTGFYYKPRMDRELIEEHAGGIIAINGHLGSEMGEHLLAYHQTKDRRHYEKAVESSLWHARVFGPNEKGEPRFYVELQHHVDEQNAINPYLIEIARDLALPLVATNDAHYLRAEDHDVHDTLICISTAKAKSDPSRMRYSPELYVKSPGEMRRVFAPYGEVGADACDNTIRIGERCAGAVNLVTGASHAPMVRVRIPEPAGLPSPDDPLFAGDPTAWYKAYCRCFEVLPMKSGADEAARGAAKAECDTALRMLAEAGMVWRYGAGADPKGPAATPTTTAPPGEPDTTDGRAARLQRELTILADKGISAYFLIVWDFVSWGRQQGIPAIARGSGVGTMVGYVLGLSNACPVKYGLLFERFTDPDRAEYPDIDIDLCQDGRARVIDYVRAKYGHVAQIITFGTLKARAAVRDVGRVMEMPLPEVDRLAKLIPEQLGTTLESALVDSPDLKKLYDGDERVRRLIDTGRALEGQARHASVHAAGVIVATRPLYEIVPLYKQAGSENGDVVTQWDGPTCEKMGLLKMDFLGLRTLSVVERCRTLIREGLPEEAIWEAVGRGGEWEAQGTRHKALAGEDPAASPARLPSALCPAPCASLHASSHPLDLDRLSFDDQRVFELFRRGDSTGVFQFESGGMRRLLLDMKPDRLEDLIAANALFRPGPMDLIPDYNRRKHGQDPVPRVHEIVDRHTAETYGVMVYQEQVMQIVHGLGGISLRDAYTLIKNISKKKHDKIEKERPRFIEGAQGQGLTKQGAGELFELILKFAGYGFNKSHSTGYAIVAYQTAYLKTYFPNQYMAAFLTFESQASKVSEWTPYLEDCKRTRFQTGKIGVEVRAPDINLSNSDFAVVFDEGEPRTACNGHVRFGLKGIKGVGDKAIEAIVREREGGGAPGIGHRASAETPGVGSLLPTDASCPMPDAPPPSPRPFLSLFDFCERVLAQAPTGSGGAVLNKGTIEALIKSGAMDRLHGRENRAAMVASIEPAVGAAQKAAADKASGQSALFGLGAPAPGAKGAGAGTAAAGLSRIAPWTELETLTKEKESLGFFVSSHPLDRWRPWASVFATAQTETAKAMPHDARVVVAGLVQGLRTLVVKTGRSAGQKMGIVTLEDLTGTAEAVLFTDCFREFEHLLVTDAVVFVLGRIDRSRVGGVAGGRGAAAAGADELAAGAAGADENKGVQILVDRIVPIDGVPLLPGRLCLRVDGDRLNGTGAGALQQTAELLNHAATLRPASPDTPGFPIDLVIDTALTRTILAADRGLRAPLTPELVRGLTDVLGEGCVRVANGVAVEAVKDDRKKWVKRAG